MNRQSSKNKSRPLNAGNHTLIMKAVMQHPLQVFKKLPARYRRRKGTPSGIEVLRSMLKVDKIDNRVKERIKMVLSILPKVEKAKRSLPKEYKKALSELQRKLTGKTISEQRTVLSDRKFRKKYEKIQLAEGMDMAIKILSDGRTSIYNANHGFYDILESDSGGTTTIARDAISDIGSMDTIGATAGGGIGTFFGGIGAAPGAVAGGVGTSAGAAVGIFLAWLLD